MNNYLIISRTAQRASDLRTNYQKCYCAKLIKFIFIQYTLASYFYKHPHNENIGHRLNQAGWFYINRMKDRALEQV
jgi:hypothetical protein